MRIRIALSHTMKPDLAHKLTVIAALRNESRSALIERILLEYIQRYGTLDSIMDSAGDLVETREKGNE
jgi:predicted transcriptional regulator